ncbi:WS/DGAT/MGAT family O-acyltransferase [Mycobacterium pseudoshottsii]|uniref:WS/DGAT/MGAT family O-acyltransferase n=1 Tax=Mycobacterium pseudoshottsii TaxID=265949 RepID=UPI00076EC86E|nr:wax ester/triacylglycerol synthase family O-acyltransferase [Mycobacterium pseudoshottsii]MBC9865681.1 Wax ester synthase/acyl-CoA:diacylglycerol acyltransferase [Mycobacterium pseudoshottsii]BBA88183.1 putative diacyglycerol O-acyltransferase Tgs4 [Mycobacterium pseudoshottsii JCM 15466]GAQ39076.1 diacylglycerol O-acyltransferase [Mycobacterium pseudoshottsii JCM 15466]
MNTNRISPIDLSFLLLERPNRPFHMTAFTIFQKPKGQHSSFGSRLFDAYRHSRAIEPFNYRLSWLGRNVARWEIVEPDMRNHVQHIVLPGPGSMAQFYETVSFLNTGLLDRGHPLWECYIIDGIEGGRIAIMLKVHHALIDGEGGLRAMRGFLSTSPHDKTLAGPWMPAPSARAPRRPQPRVSRRQWLQRGLTGIAKLPSDLAGMVGDAVDLGAQALQLKPQRGALPFAASPTLLNHTAKSAARAYANMELPLAEVKAVAKATDTSINDVVMTIVDDALHHYLDEHRAPADRPLVALMPMSMRSQAGAGNQVSAELIAMGAPKANLRQRLKQVSQATTAAKDKGNGMKSPSRQAYTLSLFASLAMSDVLPGFGKAPSANLVISNMKGPAEQLYFAGAPMVSFGGLPILPPGAGLNVTVASVNEQLCLGIGAAPEAVREPARLAQLIEQAFGQLQADIGRSAPAIAGHQADSA